jgi:ketosteroid isomerase-like protein
MSAYCETVSEVVVRTSPGRIGWASLAVVVFVLGCSARPRSADPTESTAIRAAVDSASDGLLAALRTNSMDSLLSHVADDMVMMPPNEAPVRGKAAMRNWYAGFLAQVRTTALTVSERDVFIGSGWAAERGTYEWVVTPVGGGQPSTDHGNYIQIWQRHPDGRWLFSREIWNSTDPLPSVGNK